MADLIEESRTTYIGWETNIVPQADVFRRISVVLGVAMEDLLGRDSKLPNLKEYQPEAKEEKRAKREKELKGSDPGVNSNQLDRLPEHAISRLSEGQQVILAKLLEIEKILNPGQSVELGIAALAEARELLNRGNGKAGGT